MDNTIANPVDMMMTGMGYVAATVPHQVNSLVILVSSLAPSLSRKFRSSRDGGFTSGLEG